MRFFARLVFPFFSCLLLLSSAGAQSPYFDSLYRQWSKYNLDHLQEKIYAHTDRDFYVPGETIWFALYYVDGTWLKPASLSRLAYVELLNAAHQPVLKTKIPLAQGRGAGSFELPPDLPSGQYTFRAYTNWMRNTGADYFFEKPLTLINCFDEHLPARPDSVIQYDCQFFPEGGNLVAGIESIVGFKLSDNSGRGIDANGYILQNNLDTLLSFQPAHAGMGRFHFRPEANTNYTAMILLPNGQWLRKELPYVYSKGYVMQVSRDEEGHYRAYIRARTSLEGIHADDIYLLAHARQQTFLHVAARLQNGEAVIEWKESDMQEGITHLTLFNGARQPVCERLLFKFPRHSLQLIPELDKQHYITRDAVQLAVQSQSEDSKPLSGHLSVAVYKLDSLTQYAAGGDIYSYLWLQSDLRGFIESPSWYFDAANSNRALYLDNLLLTQGWRRFRWEDMLSGRQDSSYLPEVEGQLFGARITDQQGLPIPNYSLTISIPNDRNQYYESQSDEEGKVQFIVKDYYGDRTLVLKKRLPDVGIPYKLQLIDPFSKDYSNTTWPVFWPDSNNRETLSAKSLRMQVQQLYRSGPDSLLLPPWDSLPFFGTPDNSYLLDDYTRFVTMEEVLREYVPLVTFRRVNGKLQLRMIDTKQKALYTSEPLILLDGVPLNSDSILHVDPLQIRKLDLISKVFIKGAFVYDGVVSFTSYRPDAENIPHSSGDLLQLAEGLQPEKEFYSPAYPGQEERAGSLPDYRELLYWNPDVSTGENGKARLSFYSSDIPGNYLLYMQGMDSNGRVGWRTMPFTVSEGK